MVALYDPEVFYLLTRDFQQRYGTDPTKIPGDAHHDLRCCFDRIIKDFSVNKDLTFLRRPDRLLLNMDTWEEKFDLYAPEEEWQKPLAGKAILGKKEGFFMWERLLVTPNAMYRSIAVIYSTPEHPVPLEPLRKEFEQMLLSLTDVPSPKNTLAPALGEVQLPDPLQAKKLTEKLFPPFSDKLTTSTYELRPVTEPGQMIEYVFYDRGNNLFVVLLQDDTNEQSKEWSNNTYLVFDTDGVVRHRSNEFPEGLLSSDFLVHTHSNWLPLKADKSEGPLLSYLSRSSLKAVVRNNYVINGGNSFQQNNNPQWQVTQYHEMPHQGEVFRFSTQATIRSTFEWGWERPVYTIWYPEECPDREGVFLVQNFVIDGDWETYVIRKKR